MKKLIVATILAISILGVGLIISFGNLTITERFIGMGVELILAGIEIILLIRINKELERN
jgi:hypothetical protein